MKRAYNFLLFFLLMVFLISMISAISVEKQAITNVIIPEFGQPAKFSLIFSGATEGDYSVYTLSDVKIIPTDAFSLPAGSSRADIFIYPTENLDVNGFYTFTYEVEGPERFSDKITIKIAELKDAVEISSDSNNLDSGKMTFYINNKENIELNDIKIKFSSIFFDSIEKTVSLKPYSKTEISVDVNKEELKKILAGSYLLTAKFQTLKGEKEIKGNIYLGEKKGIETNEDSAGLIIHTKSITKINIGNIPQVINIKVKKDIFTRLFTSFNNEPNLIDRNGFFVTYSWTKELEPAEIYTVKARTNFIFPLLLLIIAAILVFSFKHYTETRVDIIKSVLPVKTKGDQFALRVRINIKARKTVTNVSLIDKIPLMVKIYNRFGISKPSKIDAANRRLYWNIGTLNAGEERVYSYVVYSKVGIIGKFSLPPATAVYEKEGEIHETESNIVFFLSEQVRKEGD